MKLEDVKNLRFPSESIHETPTSPLETGFLHQLQYFAVEKEVRILAVYLTSSFSKIHPTRSQQCKRDSAFKYIVKLETLLHILYRAHSVSCATCRYMHRLAVQPSVLSYFNEPISTHFRQCRIETPASPFETGFLSLVTIFCS